MPELTTTDVATYTGGRLSANDPEVARMLTVALRVARRDAGWHVSPVRTDEFELDGPGSRMLRLPTRQLVTLTSLSENGVALDVTPKTGDLSWSVGSEPGFSPPVIVRKRGGGWWTDEYAAIDVTMTHGYDDIQAADWRQAVLSMVDQMAEIPVDEGTGMSEIGLTKKQVDDVAYSYGNAYIAMAENILFSMSAIFTDYRLPAIEFV